MLLNSNWACVAQLSNSKSFDHFGLSNCIGKKLFTSLKTRLHSYLINVLNVDICLTNLSHTKKGDKTLPQNFRPISLCINIVPILSTIFEALLSQMGVPHGSVLGPFFFLFSPKTFYCQICSLCK